MQTACLNIRTLVIGLYYIIMRNLFLRNKIFKKYLLPKYEKNAKNDACFKEGKQAPV